MVGEFARLRRHFADDRRRAKVVSRRLALHLAHMAILAGHAARRGGAETVFAERLFQPEPVEQRHVMTGAAEHRRRNAFELLDFLVDLAARLFRIGDHPVFVGVVQNPRQFRITLGPEDGRRQPALDQRQAARGLIVVLVDAVADDAGDAFPGRRVAFQVGNERVLAEVGADLIVATQAEVSVGAVGEFVDLVVERKIDGAELRIGVLGDRPFFVLLGMAGAAGRRRWEPAFGKKCGMVLGGGFFRVIPFSRYRRGGFRKGFLRPLGGGISLGNLGCRERSAEPGVLGGSIGRDGEQPRQNGGGQE